ncbi:MAG: hypothetical protein RL641_682 [Candidatus Parcubacteria bacterium]|jgi:hypothetical protein
MKVKNIFKQLKSIQMTHEEKDRMRIVLVSLSKKPSLSDYRMPIKSPVSSWTFAINFKTVGTAALVLILASTGVSFAAENTLPGDLLFPVKVNVNEEVRGALTISSEAKMDWEKERVVRRVVETERLLKTNKFTDGRKAEAESALKTQMETFATAAAETSEKNPNAVIAATAELEPALKVHSEVIAEIAAADSTKSEGTGTILNTVALGIEATSQQETVAIASAVEQDPDTFLKLTDEKITDAGTAIDTSTNDEAKIVADEAENASADNQEVSTLSEVDNSEKIVAKPQTEQATTKIVQPPTNPPEEKVKESTETKPETTKSIEPKKDATKDSISDSNLPKADTVLEATSEAKIVTPITEAKDILTLARAKLQQAKILREKGDYKEALTLAQDAYKDIVALKLQAKLSNKPKKDVRTIKNIESEIKGEVKGIETEAPSAN